HQRRLSVLEATPTVLTEFVIWLSSPAHGRVGHQPLQASSINLILQAVAALYQFLVRRGSPAVSPLQRVEVPRGRWLTEHDLLAAQGRRFPDRGAARLAPGGSGLWPGWRPCAVPAG